LHRLNTLREETVIIGDRMDTGIVAGVETEIETILVLSEPVQIIDFCGQ
jgi:NagD protein